MSTISSSFRFHENVHGIYFDDLDAFQILHNARYLLLMERTIGSFWKLLGFPNTLEVDEDSDQMHLVRKNVLEYHRPVRGISDVRVRVWVSHLGKTSLTFGFAMMPMEFDDDFATGERVLVRVDSKTRKSTAWSDALRTRLAPWLPLPTPVNR